MEISKELKQIEALAEDILQEYTNCYSEVDKEVLAKMIYNAGYRKQSDDGLILTFDGATGYFPKEFIIEAIKAYQKQEWISVEDRLPEDVYDKDRKIITVLVCTKSGRVSTSSRVRMMMLNKEKRDFEYTDIFEWSGQIAKKITHWMPLPESPKMKGGAE